MLVRKTMYLWKTYKRKDLLLGFLLFLEIIIIVVLAVTFIPLLYYHKIEAYGLVELNHMAKPAIFQSYCSIIRYLSLFHPGPLVVEHFTLTAPTLEHFADVKKIYLVMEIYAVLSLPVIIALMRSCLKDREVEFLKLTTIMTVLFLCIVGLFAATDFSFAFVLFHKIFFRNDYWLIDPQIDPVINIFPEAYFSDLLILIMIFLVIIHTFMMILYRRQRQRFLKENDYVK